MTRVFLDANVLFSAAWSVENGLLRIWRLPLLLVSSSYAIAEAERNLSRKRPDALRRLAVLLVPIEITDVIAAVEGSRLPSKDIPILGAAVGARCQVLLTGDVSDFGHLMSLDVHGIRVLTPAMLLAQSA